MSTLGTPSPGACHGSNGFGGGVPMGHDGYTSEKDPSYKCRPTEPSSGHGGDPDGHRGGHPSEHPCLYVCIYVRCLVRVRRRSCVATTLVVLWLRSLSRLVLWKERPHDGHGIGWCPTSDGTRTHITLTRNQLPQPLGYRCVRGWNESRRGGHTDQTKGTRCRMGEHAAHMRMFIRIAI